MDTQAAFWDGVAPKSRWVPFQERQNFKRGRAGELRVMQWLQEHGWFVIPSYDYAGEDGDKPPRLQGLVAAYAVPDLDAAKNACRRWVEVKTKHSANYRYTTRTYEHGIDESLLRDYEQVEKITGCEVWIAIYEESTGRLLANSLQALGEPRLGHNPADGKLIANWDCSRFKLLTTFSEEATNDRTD